MTEKTDVPARYSRQVLFEEIGEQGQARLMASKAALVGCGALGTVQASLLARAGVGTLRIIDRDFVEESNLQRQILFDEEDVRAVLPKAVAAEKKLRATNSLVQIEGVVDDLNAASIGRLLDGFDLILDATDNFDARFLLNDYAVKNGRPWIYGACVGSYGLTFPILPDETACLRCVFESAPPPGLSPTCDTAGVLGPIVGLIASLQAAEAMKILSGRRDCVTRKMAVLDVWEGRQDLVDLPPRDPDCPCCAKREFPYLEGVAGSDTATLCGRNSVQIRRRDGVKLDLDDLARRLRPLGTIEQNRFLVRADIDRYRLTLFSDGRAIVSGTNDPAVAKSIYARYVGT
ncbi:MAG TPA: ThiF family adenylyltransferase [Candidatus Polarisedimenticolia bacterium]|nr:ThiF family adenylyltransferase [Candidatus Polarisedimenticolia bacterium]